MRTGSALAADISTKAIARLAAIHAALVLVPALCILLIVLPPFAALFGALVVAVGITAARMRDMDARVATKLGAVPVEGADQARLANLVESLTMAAGVAPPAVHVIASPTTNAVAWGSDSPASIAVTTGLLEQVDRVELEAIVAHLLVCVRDHLIEVPTVATALFGDIRFGVIGALARDRWDLERIIATDLEAARLTRYPPGSAAALERLQGARQSSVATPISLRPLWIADPAGPDAADEESVHPPLGDRIDLLREL